METTRGYKAKTIKAVLAKKFGKLLDSVDDTAVRDLMRKHTIITGGSIASMLLGEPVNDFDLYFTNHATALAVAQYYVAKFKVTTGFGADIKVDDEGGRIRIVTGTGHRGETAGDVADITDPGEIEDTYDDLNEKAQNIEAGGEYRPVFISTNAITLSDRMQIVLRFYGDADALHENYDFVHCTNYWTSGDGKLVLRPEALEALLSKELRYVGSKYPLCSIMRLRKFIKRGWTVNAGQILKMAMQLNDLNLLDVAVLEDQLTGVDSAYFVQIIQNLQEKDAEKVNAAYLVEIIDRLF